MAAGKVVLTPFLSVSPPDFVLSPLYLPLCLFFYNVLDDILDILLSCGCGRRPSS